MRGLRSLGHSITAANTNSALMVVEVRHNALDLKSIMNPGMFFKP